jgi:hypothetical protein
MTLWLTLLLLGSMVLFIFVAWVLRLLRPRQADMTSHDFSIEQLLRLHQAGQISAEEFERAKAEVLARRPADPIDPSKRGFEVLQAPRPTFQSLEERSSP